MNKQDQGRTIYVQITDREHPHFREYGVLTGKVIRMNFGRQQLMAEVKLDNCRHGTDACFVEKGQVTEVQP